MINLSSKDKKQLKKNKKSHPPTPQKKKKKLKKSITKIDCLPRKKAYKSFNVDIMNNKSPQVQVHRSKEFTKDFLIGELNKMHGIKINI